MPRPHVRRLRGTVAPGVRLRRVLKVHVTRARRDWIVATAGRYPYCEYGVGSTFTAAATELVDGLTASLAHYDSIGRDRLGPLLQREYDWLRHNLLLEVP